MVTRLALFQFSHEAHGYYVVYTVRRRLRVRLVDCTTAGFWTDWAQWPAPPQEYGLGSTRHIPQLLRGKISAVLNSHQLVLVHDMAAVIVVVTQDSGWSRKRRREVVGVYKRVRRNVWIPTSVYLNWTVVCRARSTTPAICAAPRITASPSPMKKLHFNS